MAGSRVRLAVGLDAGSAYTRCVVCVVEDGKIRFLGSGEVESKGWTKSRIADRDVMSECIRQAAREAERQAQISFDAVVLTTSAGAPFTVTFVAGPKPPPFRVIKSPPLGKASMGRACARKSPAWSG